MEHKLESLDELIFFKECHDFDGKFLFTQCVLIEPDSSAHIARLPKTKRQLSIDDIEKGLTRIPDEDIYPRVRRNESLTLAPKQFPDRVFIKRPCLVSYNELKAQGLLRSIQDQIVTEARNVEKLSKLPKHPGILRYRGCITNRGFITGIMYDEHICDLETYITFGEEPPIDKKVFMRNLISAVAHLHSAGIAHNDITPYNIPVNDAGQPVLADFDSCFPVGEPLTIRTGTLGWIENDDATKYTTSDMQHDLYALEKLRTWLDERL